MNGQMNNQYQQQPNTNLYPQTQAPMNGQMPMMQQMPVKQSKSFKEVIEDLKSKNVFKIIGIIAGVLIILGVFLPMVTVKYGSIKESTNLWDASTFERFVVMILGVVAILTYVFNKFKYLSNISAGASLIIALSYFDSWFKLSAITKTYTHLSLAFFVYLLAFIVLVVLNVLDNIDEVLELFNPKPKAVIPVVNVNNMAQPNFTQPVNQFQQVQTPVQPVVTEVLCTGCGAKKVGNETFCQNCGKQF